MLCVFIPADHKCAEVPCVHSKGHLCLSIEVGVLSSGSCYFRITKSDLNVGVFSSVLKRNTEVFNTFVGTFELQESSLPLEDL